LPPQFCTHRFSLSHHRRGDSGPLSYLFASVINGKFFVFYCVRYRFFSLRQQRLYLLDMCHFSWVLLSTCWAHASLPDLTIPAGVPYPLFFPFPSNGSVSLVCALVLFNGELIISPLFFPPCSPFFLSFVFFVSCCSDPDLVFHPFQPLCFPWGLFLFPLNDPGPDQITFLPASPPPHRVYPIKLPFRLVSAFVSFSSLSKGVIFKQGHNHRPSPLFPLSRDPAGTTDKLRYPQSRRFPPLLSLPLPEHFFHAYVYLFWQVLHFQEVPLQTAVYNPFKLLFLRYSFHLSPLALCVSKLR